MRPPAGAGCAQSAPLKRGARRAACALAIVVAAVAAYAPALRAGYVWDDDKHVTENPTLRGFGGLRAIWSDGFATPQYYPLVHTSYWIEHRLWGLAPFGYHVDNVLLHLAGAWLFYRVLAWLTLPGAGIAAALFALHPVHVESVAWITERKNVLSGVFYFGAALAYLRAPEGAAPSMVPVDRRRYYGSLALFVCALLSKSVTVTLPVTLALVVLARRGRPSRDELAPLVPMLVMGLVLASVTAWLEKHHVGAAGEDWGLTLLDRGVIASRALVFYPTKLVWPHPLMFVYPRWDVAFGHGFNAAWPLAVGAAFVGLFALRSRIGVAPLTIAAIYAVTLSPALGFVDFYPMRFSFVADHFQYHASAAPLAALGWLGPRLAARAPSAARRAAPVALVVVLAALGLTTWTRAHAYRDEASLWRDTLSKNPAAWLAHLNLGRLYGQAGDLAAAGEHLTAAVRLEPDEGRVHINLGALLLLEGRVDEAIEELRQGTRLEPRLADGHVNLGLAYERRGDREQAIRSYRRALEVEATSSTARARLRDLSQ
ncbi:MAG: tetratricopeptide repeat protein [Deltaproteobacteria bacterium]|nr:tetratricopeptide repeat protein [Deltaproteobacteria bacterium]